MSEHALNEPLIEIKSLLSDLFEMTKPKVVLLMLITAWVGMALTPVGQFPWWQAFIGTIGIGLLAASGAAFNHIIDQQIDQKMARTHRRPVATGRISTSTGLLFASSLACIGGLLLFALVNELTAILTLFSMVGYALIYTVYLKRSTPQNIVIGGLAGAMPPLLGWTAITGSMTGLPLLLVLIIFIWTPPHFWSLAIHRRDDYAKANIPMMPVTHGIEFTRIQVCLYSWLLLAVSFLPIALGVLGGIYGIAALVLGIKFLYWSYCLKNSYRIDAAWGMFKFSIQYLLYLFLSILLDHYLWHTIVDWMS